MKCQACQFDDEIEQERQFYEVEVKFLEIEGHFTILKESWHNNRVEVSIYACPKCGTLKTDAI